MAFELDRDGDRLVVKGALTIYEASDFNAALMLLDEDVSLDLADVSEFDGAGLQALVAFEHQQAENGRALRLVRVSNVVEEALRVIGADRYWAPMKERAV